METLHDSLSMFVVIGKDNGLSDLRTVVGPQSVFHQDIEDFTDRVLIENPLIQGRRSNAFRKFSIFILKSIFVNPLIFLG